MRFLKIDISTPLQFTLGGQFHSDQPWSHAKRIIDTYELIIGTKETLYMQQEQERYEVTPGQIMLLEPHRPHEGYQACDPGLAFDWLHFCCQESIEIVDEEAVMQETAVGHSLNSLHTLENTFIYIPFFFTPPIIDRIHIQFRQLMHVANSPDYNVYATHYLLTSLLIEVSEQALQHLRGVQQGGKQEHQISNIMEWTRVHALEKIHVQDVANYFNYNRDYLSRFFKQHTGINLQEYIHRQKLLKAKELLSRSNLTVQQISHEVGISDEKYFMKLFKAYEGMTPTDFRRAYYQTFMNME
ncbi:AraC-like DNA-binding protein [Paenibacillus sp. DS2015]|uniref:helix-turn-helix transcriptional regulator n=1 Tax=Paenibacillus sp. DS2015 TaxID=3373917 RepID=UPI003D1A5701